jgi:hypothetical protein
MHQLEASGQVVSAEELRIFFFTKLTILNSEARLPKTRVTLTAVCSDFLPPSLERKSWFRLPSLQLTTDSYAVPVDTELYDLLGVPPSASEGAF